MFWIVASTIPVVIGVTMVFVRIKSATHPTSAKKIILPPLFMSTGLAMFLFPSIYVTWLEVAQSLGLGIIFSFFLIKTSHFTVKNQNIYLVPSKFFIIIIVCLLLFRLFLKWLIGSIVSIGVTSGMFFLLALGMIFTWRIVMLIQYKKLKRYQIQTNLHK